MNPPQASAPPSRAEGNAMGRRALVIGGAGRMGGWCSRFLRAQGYAVEIADPAPLPDDLSMCARRAAWDEGDLTHDLIVVAAPLRQTAALLLALAERRPPGMVLDLGSLKSPLRAGLDACAKAGMRVTSVHPMFGPAVDRLDGRHVVIIDVGSAEANAAAVALFAGTHAIVVEMTLDEHDQAMAYVLGLSHAVNIAFFGALSRSGSAAEHLARVSSTTFEAQLDVAARVAGENPHLYFEIQHLNAHGLAALDALGAAVEQLRSAVASGDEATFVRAMEQGRRYLTERRGAP
jgi:chorismate mutase / prephenate dehydrogenase